MMKTTAVIAAALAALISSAAGATVYTASVETPTLELAYSSSNAPTFASTTDGTAGGVAGRNLLTQYVSGAIGDDYTALSGYTSMVDLSSLSGIVNKVLVTFKVRIGDTADVGSAAYIARALELQAYDLSNGYFNVLQDYKKEAFLLPGLRSIDTLTTNSGAPKSQKFDRLFSFTFTVFPTLTPIIYFDATGTCEIVAATADG